MDDDVAVICAEALMDLRPWDLWSLEGEARPETGRVVGTLEVVLARLEQAQVRLHLGPGLVDVRRAERRDRPLAGLQLAAQVLGEPGEVAPQAFVVQGVELTRGDDLRRAHHR
jgi:hypothetical protein